MDKPEKNAPATGEDTSTEHTEHEHESPSKPAEDKLGEAGIKALKEERKARQAAEKELNALRAKVEEFENAQLSEKERLEKRAAEAEKAAQKATARLARMEAALAAKLPLDLVDRLQGETPEELREDAEKLAALLKPADEGATPPPGSFDGGPRPPQPKKSLDEQIAEAEAKKDWKTAAVLKAQKLAQLAQQQQG